MLYRYFAVLFLLGIILAGNLSLTHPVSAETLVESIVETRLMVALRVRQAGLQKWLPAPWQVDPMAGGPFKEANLVINFIDRLLIQDPHGKPGIGGVDRLVVFGVPAKHTQTGELAFFVIRGFTANTRDIPGPYKNYVQATIRREQTHKGANLEAEAGDDSWEVRDTRGGIIELRVQYQGGLPSRDNAEQKIYSSVEPSFFRIYRMDLAMDIVRSIPSGIDRVQNYQLRVAVPELGKLFDGAEQLLAVAVFPLNLRQVFLP